jgi:hypothetical protein
MELVLHSRLLAATIVPALLLTLAPRTSRAELPDFADAEDLQQRSHSTAEAPGASRPAQRVVYLSVSQTDLTSSQLPVGGNLSRFDSTALTMGAVEVHSRLLSLFPKNGSPSMRELGLWMNAGVGAATSVGHLANASGATIGGQSASLLAVNPRAGASVFYEHVPWLRPCLGVETGAEVYHLSSTVGGSTNGLTPTISPVAGVHFTDVLGSGASAYVEVRHLFVLGASDVFADGTTMGLGLGLVF